MVIPFTGARQSRARDLRRHKMKPTFKQSLLTNSCITDWRVASCDLLLTLFFIHGDGPAAHEV